MSDIMRDDAYDICCDPSKDSPISRRMRARSVAEAMDNLMHRRPSNLNHDGLSVDGQATDDQFHETSSKQVEMMDMSSPSDLKARYF